MADPAYRRVVLKLSGEGLMGDAAYGIDPAMLRRLAGEMLEMTQMGVELAVVVGGGNIFRGEGLARKGMDRVTGDHMGMLATVINALALQDALEAEGGQARVMSAIRVHDVCEDYIRRRAIRHLEKGRIVIFAAGTGSPFFSTDTGASLRASEINADALLKATQVAGVYSADPKIDDNAKLLNEVTYERVINEGLNVMDTTAVVMCRDNQLPIRVFNLFESGNLKRVVMGEPIGSLVQLAGEPS